MHPRGALFLFLNYAAVALISLRGPQLSSGSTELVVRGFGSNLDTPASLVSRRPAGNSQNNNQNQQGKSCKCAKCKENKVRHRKKCRICVPCPKNTKSDPTHRTCIPETDDGKKPKEKGKKYEEEKKKRKKEFKERKFDKYKEKWEKAKEKFKEMKEREEREQREKEEREKHEKEKKERKSKRAGWCWAILAEGGAWAAADYEGVSEDDINGLTELWPDGVPEPAEAAVPEWNLRHYQIPNTMVPDMDVAGFGAIIKALGKLFQAAKPAVSEAFQNLKNMKPSKPTQRAVEGAKKSNFVKKVLKDKRFQDCISATAGAAALVIGGEKIAEITQKSVKFETFDGEARWGWEFDMAIKKEDIAAAPKGENDGKQIHFYYGVNEDDHKKTNGFASHYYTHDDYGLHTDRLPYQRCKNIKDWGNGYPDNKITALGVDNGCCAFYDGENCKKDTFLFAMTNREDGELTGKENDAISSLWCTFDKLCNGKP
ncbi:hypothetical protein CC78DRAFT_528575 [Lojkania enalia]|uniref:Uncharacterized protein n=1 Tax=Lojkania enalia TaxID=147567 RepID=A0A9P4NBD2_9PLEO|nr:hypothetical protein CC78DRAFT_528575 [Didymosphaeria enalia]